MNAPAFIPSGRPHSNTATVSSTAIQQPVIDSMEPETVQTIAPSSVAVSHASTSAIMNGSVIATSTSVIGSAAVAKASTTPQVATTSTADVDMDDYVEGEVIVVNKLQQPQPRRNVAPVGAERLVSPTTTSPPPITAPSAQQPTQTVSTLFGAAGSWGPLFPSLTPTPPTAPAPVPTGPAQPIFPGMQPQAPQMWPQPSLPAQPSTGAPAPAPGSLFAMLQQAGATYSFAQPQTGMYVLQYYESYLCLCIDLSFVYSNV